MCATPLSRSSAHARRDRSEPAATLFAIPSMRDRWAKALAFAFLDGDWTAEGLGRRGGLILGHTRPTLRSLVMEVMKAYPRPPWDRWRELASWVGLNPALDAAVAEARTLSPTRWLPFQPAMAD